MSCEHRNFETRANVEQQVDKVGSVVRLIFTASVICKDCNEVFYFRDARCKGQFIAGDLFTPR